MSSSRDPGGDAAPGGAIERATDELRRRLPGRVVTGGLAMRRFSSDFGAARRAVPGIVVCARRESDVVAALAVARAHRLAVTLRGGGHSVAGQTLSRGALVIANAGEGEPPRLLEGGRVEVSARSRWRAVERVLNRPGRRVPVLADYLGLSVGGTLSVGTYGADSVAHGALVDHVERLRLIRPDGTAVWCSADENRELFRYSLAGLGQVGVIEKAVLRTVPDSRFTTLFDYRHRSLSEMVDAWAWMADARRAGSGGRGPELFKGLYARGRFVSTFGVGSPTLGRALVAPPPAMPGRPVGRLVAPRYRLWRHLTVTLWVARFGLRRHLWFDYILDFEAFREFAALTSELLRRDAFAGCLKSIYVVAVRRPEGALDLPFEAAGPGGGLKLGIGFYNMVPRGDGEGRRRVDEAAGICLDRCLQLGGRPYLYGWHRLAAAALERLYGDDLRRLRELKGELDPEGLFQPSGPLAGHP